MLTQLFLTVSALWAQTSAAEIALWGSLSAGPHVAGYDAIHTVDATRPMPTGSDGTEPESGQRRPVQISVWYPAAASEGHLPLTVRRYVEISVFETADQLGTVSEDDWRKVGRELSSFPIAAIDEATKNAWLRATTGAYWQAPPLAGPFPLLVIAQGNHDPAYRHHVLAEYLASHGYVVATAPSASRYVRDRMDMNFGLENYFNQVSDTAWVLDYITSQHSSVDPDQIMLFGFSMGGNTGGYNLLRDRRIKGFVCFDCGVASRWGTPALHRFLDNQFPKSAHRPLAFLNIFKPDDRVDLSFVESFADARVWNFQAPDARHFNFTSLAPLTFLGVADPQWLAGGAGARAVHYESIVRARHFLDLSLKQMDDARAQLENVNGLLVAQP